MEKETEFWPYIWDTYQDIWSLGYSYCSSEQPNQCIRTYLIMNSEIHFHMIYSGEKSWLGKFTQDCHISTYQSSKSNTLNEEQRWQTWAGITQKPAWLVLWWTLFLLLFCLGCGCQREKFLPFHHPFMANSAEEKYQNQYWWLWDLRHNNFLQTIARPNICTELTSEVLNFT